jgi:pyruvate dehydrogenase E2 component (dihydrolipoamide acetyltransferase)
MAQIIGLPKLSPTMEEGVLLRWVKKEGDKVSPGDLVAEVETDKANMDFNIEDDGVLLKLLVKEGETVKLGAPVAILGRAGEDIAALLEEAASAGPGAARAPVPTVTVAPAPAATSAAAQPMRRVSPSTQAAHVMAPPLPPPVSVPAAPATSATPPAAATSRVLASPLAKTMAIDMGIDLRSITGTGPGGRIVERDVQAAAAATASDPLPVHASTAAPAPVPSVAPSVASATAASDPRSTAIAVRSPAMMGDDNFFTDQPASNMRKRIAARLTEAKRDVPHFYLQRSIDAAPLLAFRARLNELLGDRGKVSVNDLVVKAAALALRRVPECNAAWMGDAIRYFHRVHMGIAVAIDDGLVTPVVRDADLKGIGAIAAEVRDLAERARSRNLKGHEITGSTFTISNLGMFGIERFTAILNPPEAGILAVGGVLDAAVVSGGQVVAGKRMTVSMSCDHRVIDGALGARWMIAFAELLEKPESLAL